MIHISGAGTLRQQPEVAPRTFLHILDGTNRYAHAKARTGSPGGYPTTQSIYKTGTPLTHIGLTTDTIRKAPAVARLTPHHGDQQPPATGNTPTPPTWRELVDKWLHNPTILAALLIAFLALLAALVLIAGLAGVGLGALITALAFPAAQKARKHTNARTTEQLPYQHDHTNPDDQ